MRAMLDRGNMDSIAICILTCNMHIAEIGNMDIDSKPFLFRRKESTASHYAYCTHIGCLP